MIVPLFDCINIHWRKIFLSLTDLGLTPEDLGTKRSELNRIFMDYKCNLIKEQDSREQFKTCLPNIINDGNIDSVWNSACEFNDNTTKIFDDLSALQKLNTWVYFYGYLNKTHLDFFKKEYGKARAC